MTIESQQIVIKKNRTNPALILLFAAPMVTFAVGAETAVDSDDDGDELRVTLLRDSFSDRQPLKTAFPSYPSIARRDRNEGEATVCFDIDARGKIKRASIKSYTHKIFRKPSLRAIRRSSFVPLQPDQVLARNETCRTYRFRLNEV